MKGLQTRRPRLLLRLVPQHTRPDGKPKRPHADEAAARRWLDDHDLTGEVYRCRWCQSWHVAHTAPIPSTQTSRPDPDTYRHIGEFMGELEDRRRAERIAIRDARQAWWWQEVQS